MKPTNRRSFSWSSLILGSFLLMPGLALTGCSDDNHAENAGEEIDDAIDDTGDALEDAADDVEDAFDD